MNILLKSWGGAFKTSKELSYSLVKTPSTNQQLSFSYSLRSVLLLLQVRVCAFWIFKVPCAEHDVIEAGKREEKTLLKTNINS